MKKLFLAIILFAANLNAQVGIGTETPTATLDVVGDVRIHDIKEVSSIEYVLVSDNEGFVKKIPFSNFNTTEWECPRLVEKTSYWLKFESIYTIKRPNDGLVIEGINFSSSGAWINSNKYFFTYTNVTGRPLNINRPISVNFVNGTCEY